MTNIQPAPTQQPSLSLNKFLISPQNQPIVYSVYIISVANLEQTEHCLYLVEINVRARKLCQHNTVIRKRT